MRYEEIRDVRTRGQFGERVIPPIIASRYVVALLATVIIALTSTVSFGQTTLESLKNKLDALSQQAQQGSNNKKQTSTQQKPALGQPNVSVRNASTGAKSHRPIPSSSTAFIDVLGFHLGKSGVKEVEDALVQIKPKLDVKVYEIVLAIDEINPATNQYVEIPNTKHVKTVGGSGHSGINVNFASPPSKHVAITASRKTYYNSPQGAPSLENMLSALNSKYGEGTVFVPATPVDGTTGVAWAWSADGKPLHLGKGSACISDVAVILGDSAASVKMARDNLDEGCAAVLTAVLSYHNNIVTLFNVDAIDIYNYYVSKMKTYEFSEKYKREYVQQIHEKANKQKAPQL